MTTELHPSNVDRTDEVLRVHAAALAAQQTASTEPEIQLRERRQYLEQQERQLAALLAEKQHQVLALQDQLGTGRDRLRQDRAMLDALSTQTEAAHREATAERDRLRDLRSRFVKRWKKHWVNERRAIRTQSENLQRAANRLQHERDAFDQFRKRFHGEAELDKRRIQDEWRALTEEQVRLQAERRQFNADMAHREAELNDRATALNQVEQTLLHNRQQTEQHCEALRDEARGLEKRISNLRRVLVEQERRRALAPDIALPSPPALEVPPIPPLPPDIEAAIAARDHDQQVQQAALERQAVALADQRLHLAELCQRLADMEAGLHVKHADSVEELENLAGNLQFRDESSQARMRNFQSAADRLRLEREAVVRIRRKLERGMTDLSARQTAWHGERNRLLAEVSGRERAIDRRERALTALFRRWRDRRAAEVSGLRQTIQVMSEERLAWAKQRDEWRHRSQALREAMQAIAEQALALEEVRQELGRHADCPQSASRRLERLRRRYEGFTKASRRELDKRRLQLDEAETELDARLHTMREQATLQTERERELAGERAEAESQRLRFEEENRRLETERAVWREQRHHYERQLAQMRDEVERVARLLIDDETDIHEPLAA